MLISNFCNDKLQFNFTLSLITVRKCHECNCSPLAVHVSCGYKTKSPNVGPYFILKKCIYFISKKCRHLFFFKLDIKIVELTS